MVQGSDDIPLIMETKRVYADRLFRSPPPLSCSSSLSLSLSHTHTHTHTHSLPLTDSFTLSLSSPTHSHMQQNLKEYDRDILNELWKIRSGIQEIHKAHKQSEEAEKKYLDDSIPDRSPSPEEVPSEDREMYRLPQHRYVLTKKPSPEPSPSPAQSHTPIESTPPPSEQPMLPSHRCNTLDLMRTAPSHLMPSDDQLLEEFFGHDQVDKLNLFKKSLEDEKTKKEEEEKEYEAFLRKNAQKKLQIPVNPNRRSARYSCDVASEMEQLRARLHETAFKELEEFDKKFSPKLTRPGINPASGESSHSHQGSLDSSYPPQLSVGSSPQLLQVRHRRDYSLPVYMDPSSTSSPQSGSSNSSPFTSRSATQLLRNQGGEEGGGEVNDRSPTPPFQYGHIRQLSAGSTSSGSGTFSPPPNAVVTLPTTKQQPSPSFTGGGGGLALSYNMPRYGGSGGALNRYQNYDQASKLSGSSAPTGRAPNPNNPQFHSLKQSRTQQPQHPVLTRTGSSGITGAGGGGGGVVGGGASGMVTMGTNLSFTRNSSGGGVSKGGMGGAGGGGSGLVTIGTNLSLKRNSTTNTSNSNNTSSSLNRIRNAVPLNSQQVLPNPASNGVVVRRPEATTSTQPHYSTSVIKKRRSNPSPDGSGSRRSSGENFQASEVSGNQHHQSRNGYPGTQMLSANMNHNNLGSSGSDVSILLPEQKSVPKPAQQGRLMASYERLSASPKMARKPLVQKGSSGVVASSAVANSSQNSTTLQQQSSVLRKSEPNLLDRNSSSVYPENIQPYMSTGDVKTQMKYYKYTPYTNGGKMGGQVDTSSNTPESTWC